MQNTTKFENASERECKFNLYVTSIINVRVIALNGPNTLSKD